MLREEVSATAAAAKEEQIEKELCTDCDTCYPPGEMTVVCNENPLTGRKEKRKCKGCNAFKKRLTGVVKKDVSLKPVTALKGEDRVGLYRKCRLMFDSSLDKVLREKVQQIERERQLVLFTEEGDFFDVADVEEKYRDKPEDLALIKENAIVAKHPLTKKEELWMPKLSLKRLTEHELSKTNEQTVEQEHVVKKMKKPRVEATEADKENADANAVGQQEGSSGKRAHRNRTLDDVPQSIPEGQIERIESMVPKLEAKNLEHQRSTMAMVTEPGATQFIPPMLKDAATQVATQMATHLETAKQYLASKEALKGAVGKFFADVKETTTQKQQLDLSLKPLIEMMKKAQADKSTNID